ncbi:hypothetical protein UFOVP642_2 [uncultured Caudovirales phage]|uniref:Uncharacterized protein n=1 Tax=uncultured Caudovirales phage TaxID=2100421 RepID=A0A6J5N7J7_9CAUD|nr:hypothetical protein UFOVP642_2 [uncultured Caudovirales phage]
MYDYEILYDDYIGYRWDNEAGPERRVYYTGRTATQALRRFYEDYPLYAINRIQRRAPETSEKV